MKSAVRAGILIGLLCPLQIAAQDAIGSQEGLRLLERHCESSGKPEALRLGGTVRDLLTTAPAPGVEVSIQSAAQNTGYWTVRTDSAGYYFFCQLTELERPQVTATLSDGTSQMFDVDLQPYTWARPVYFETVRPARLAGRVTTARTGDPIANVPVSVGPVGLGTRTAADGTFQLRGIAGQIRLGIEHPDNGDWVTPFWMDGGFEYSVEIQIGGPAESPAPIILTRGTTPTVPDPEAYPPRIVRPEFPTLTGSEAIQLGPLDWEAHSVRPGRRVSLTARGVSIPEGILAAVGPESLLVEDGDQHWTVPLDGLESLSVKTRSSRRLALIIGAFGASAGAVIGHVFLKKQDRCFDDRGSAPRGQEVVLSDTGGWCTIGPYGLVAGALRGGVGGAAFGLAVGTMVFHWRTVF